MRVLAITRPQIEPWRFFEPVPVNKARLLGGATRQLDAALEDASPGFRQANANFARSSRDIGAIGAGRDAFLRGRTEDTIPAFSVPREPDPASIITRVLF